MAGDKHSCTKEGDIAALEARMNNMDKWQKSQNGSLDKMADAQSDMSRNIGILTERMKITGVAAALMLFIIAGLQIVNLIFRG